MEGNSSIILVSVSVRNQAVSSNVSEVVGSSTEVGKLLEVLVSPWSDVSIPVLDESLTILVGNGIVSSSPGSYGVSSSVEYEPLSVFTWKGSSESEFVLMRSSVLVVMIDSSVTGHS